MALIRKQELRQMDEKQIGQRLAELGKELLRLNTQRATGTTLENPGKVKQVRKTIARLLTYRNAKKAQVKSEPELPSKTSRGGKAHKK